MNWLARIKDADDKDTFAASIHSASHVLEKLAEILYDKIEAAEKSSTEDYQAPAWAYYQADIIGYKRALREVIELTKLSAPKE